jgi:hypothetical protein
MGDSYYPAAYGGGRLDFSGIESLADSIGGAITTRMDKNAVQNALAQATSPDGAVDYNKAFGNLLAAGRTKEAQVIANYAESQAMGQYRQDMLAATADKANAESPDIKLWREWNAINGSPASPVAPEPMRASPPQPSGVPGVSLQNAPAFIQDKLMPVGERKQLEAEGTKQGERNAQKATMSEVGPGMQKLIDQLIVNAQEADAGTFENALGPLQGAGEAETLTGAAAQFFPQTAGSIANYFDKGMKEGFVDWKTGNIKAPGDLSGGYTTTLRSKINATSASLISVLQRALRVPGIGAQSDYELRQIVNQVGELNKSRTKEDFYDRLSNVVSNFKSLGIPVEMPTQEALAGVKPTSSAVQNYTQPAPAQEAGAVPYDAAAEAPPQSPPRASATTIGGEPAIVGPGAAPPMVRPADMNRLKLHFNKYRNDPAALGELKRQFDAKYDPDGSYKLFDALLSEISGGR